MSTNAQRKNKLNASVSEAIIETSKIDTDVALAATVAIVQTLSEKKTAFGDASGELNDTTYLLVANITSLFSGNLNSKGEVPFKGGIKPKLVKACADVGIKQKAFNVYMQASANSELHKRAIPANSSVKEVQRIFALYGWTSVSKIRNALKGPLAWNDDCEETFQNMVTPFLPICAHHEDEGAQSCEGLRNNISKAYFKGMDNKEVKNLSTSKREPLPKLAEQQAAYDAAEQAAQLAATKKQTKQ